MKSEICIVLRSQILFYKLVRKKSDLKENEKAVNLSKSSAYSRQHILAQNQQRLSYPNSYV